MAYYTDQAKVETLLGRSLTANEITLLALHQEAVKTYIDEIVGGEFGDVAETTRYFDGGTFTLDIDTCNTVTAVKLVDHDETVLYSYDIDTELEIAPRNETTKHWIERRYEAFPIGLRNISVTAKFSYGAVPNDIAMIATMMAASLLSEGIEGKLESESIEGYSRKFATSMEKGELSTRRTVIDTVLAKYTMGGGILI